MTKKKRQQVRYGPGQIEHFRSSEALARHLDRVKREQERQKEEKAKKEGKGDR